eukprot:6198-Heterococcus_DN1.PRE.2
METLHLNSPLLHEASTHEFSTAGLDELQDDEGLELELDLDTSFTAAHDAMGLNDVQADPDSELEAIRSSVHRLRQQRHAVLRLKAFASKSNAKAANLERELTSAREQLHKLQRDSTRQTTLQRAVAELRESLKQQQQATSDKEQALRRAEADKRALREKLAAEQSRHVHYIKEHKSEVHSLKQLLREARDMLDSTQASLEAQSGSEAAIIEQNYAVLHVVPSSSLMWLSYTQFLWPLHNLLRSPTMYTDLQTAYTQLYLLAQLQLRSEKEALLFNRGELEERLHELTVTVDKQRTALSEQHTAQRTAAARLEAVTAERGVLLSELHTLRKAAKADKLSRSSSTATDTVRGLKEQCSAAAHKLEQAQSEAAALRHVCSAKEGQLSQLRRELTTARAENTSQFALKDALKEARREAAALRKQLEREKAERTQWAQARTQLLSQFYSEEARLESVLGACDLDATAASSSSAAVR